MIFENFEKNTKSKFFKSQPLSNFAGCLTEMSCMGKWLLQLQKLKQSQQTVGVESINASKHKNTDLFLELSSFQKMALKLLEFLEQFIVDTVFWSN